MPSDDGKYEDMKEEKQKDRDDDDDDMEARGGVQDYEQEPPEGGVVISKTLHYIMLGCLFTTFCCLLAIVPTRSLGIPKRTKGSMGVWEVCVLDGEEICYTEWLCGDGNRKASGAFGILSIILCLVMLLLQIFKFSKPEALAPFAKIQCALCHVFWIFLLICWATFAAALDEHHGCTPQRMWMYYAWGFVFLVGMWCVYFLLAIVWTFKALNKKICGL